MTEHDGNVTAPWVETVGKPFEGFSDALLAILFFIVLVLVSYAIGRGARWAIERLRRGPPTARSILGSKVSMLLWMAIVLGFGLTAIFEVDLLSMFATLGLVSLALGFGLQNTVANLAAGVGLSIDAPFQVGDRIRVGDTWGDVVSIGLRSTRIRTTSGEQVAIPNAVLDTQEVWNNTPEKQVELRVEMPFSISYDSSVQLAESIALRAARRHERVLAYPEPKVQVKAMGADGIEMELRGWIDQARIRPAVMDRLYRDMLREFDQQGIIVPYPHQVNVDVRDLPEPAPTPEFLEESEDAPLVLVATRGSAAAQSMAESIMHFVKELGARAIILHVRSPAMRFHHVEADKALNHYMTQAAEAGVKVRARSEVGDVAGTIAAVAKEEGARLIILGQTMHRGRATGWYKNEVAAATRAAHAPVLPLQTHLTQSKEFVQRWYERLRPEPEPDDEGDDD